MILERIGRDTYAREIGVVADDGQILERGLAELLRSPLARWGLSPKTAILRYARSQLEAVGILTQTSDRVARILARMVRLGECAEVRVGDEPYIAPGQPRWVRTGKESGTLLGVAPVPEGVEEHVSKDSGQDIVRRIWVRDDEDQAVLSMSGIAEISLRDWLSPFDYLTHGSRRMGSLIRSETLSLSGFWEILASDAENYAQPLSDDASIRTVVGEPGGYFGSYNAHNCEGRWQEEAGEGVWCAYRRGYGPKHWHPIILVVDGIRRRAMDLQDGDEWRWALLARGHCKGMPERVRQVDGRVQLTFPVPHQILAALDIMGPRRDTWSWEVHPAAPDPWAELR